jgi:hypothetical protein
VELVEEVEAGALVVVVVVVVPLGEVVEVVVV